MSLLHLTKNQANTFITHHNELKPPFKIQMTKKNERTIPDDTAKYSDDLDILTPKQMRQNRIDAEVQRSKNQLDKNPKQKQMVKDENELRGDWIARFVCCCCIVGL